MAWTICIGKVEEVEGEGPSVSYDGLRIKAKLTQDSNDKRLIPWAFPLLPKTIHTLPKKGEAVFVFVEEEHGTIKNSGARYFIGPIISQDQYREKCPSDIATSLLPSRLLNPIVRVSNYPETKGSLPKTDDVALVGRGQEDVTLKYDGKVSEIDIRAGIRKEPVNPDDPNFFGNIVFNNVDPAYIQLKFKNGLATKEKHQANSIINMVANRINIMSNKDDAVSHNLNDPKTLIPDDKMDEVMDNLHPLAKGDELVNLLEIMKGAILTHVHPWPGMKTCGDWEKNILALSDYNISDILSDYVRIS